MIEFQIPYDDGCTNNYIQLINGTSTSSPEIGRYCGTTLPVHMLLGVGAKFVFVFEGPPKTAEFSVDLEKSRPG